MIHKELANLSIDMMSLLVGLYKQKKISKEEFTANATAKADFLKKCLKGNEDFEQCTRINETLSIYKKMTGNDSYCL